VRDRPVIIQHNRGDITPLEIKPRYDGTRLYRDIRASKPRDLFPFAPLFCASFSQRDSVSFQQERLASLICGRDTVYANRQQGQRKQKGTECAYRVPLGYQQGKICRPQTYKY
jgi:hypothetical protein